MLKLNLEYLLKLKNRSDGRIYLVTKKEMPYGKARKLTNGTAKTVAFATIVDLCELLDCKLSDLFEYIPEEGRVIPGLVELIRDPNMRSLAERMEDRSAEEIKWLMQKLDEAEEELRRMKEELRKKGEGPVGG